MELTEDRYAKIAENYARVQENIAAAIARRNPAITTPVRVLAATKTVPPDEILFAAQKLGIKLIGENRPQELTAKYDALRGADITQHFIGHLQVNKVRQVVGYVSLVESVDTERLAVELNRRSEMLGIVTDILLEVNSGREPNKSGLMPEALPKAVEFCRALPNLRLRGLMTMAPVCEEKEGYRKFFSETYKLYIDIFGKMLHNNIEPLQPILSMGMSDSYEIAIEEGATEVRLGQAIFERRVYPQTEQK